MSYPPTKASASQLETINLQKRDDLNLVIQQLNCPKKIMIEIGSLFGMSTKVFSRHFEKVYSIDPYLAGYDNNDPNSNPAKIALAEKVFQIRFYDEPNVEQIKRNVIIINRKVFLFILFLLHLYFRIKLIPSPADLHMILN